MKRIKIPGTVVAEGGIEVPTGQTLSADSQTLTGAKLAWLSVTTAGTAEASKALIMGTTKNIDTLDITTPKINGTAIGSTAAELDVQCDDSARVETVVAAGACSLTVAVTKLAVVSGGAVTLAAPSRNAFMKVIKMTTDDGDVTLALTNVVGGSAATTATFDAVGDTLVLISDVNSSGKWIVLKEVGVTLS